MHRPLAPRTSGSRPETILAFTITMILTCAPVPLSTPSARAAEARSAVFDWGYTLRLRQEYLRNVFDFSNDVADDRNCLRVRSQLWASWTPNATWKAFVMLNNEHRHWYKSATGLEHQEFEIDEIIFENLYLQASKIGGTPFGFTIGRQNLFWVVLQRASCPLSCNATAPPVAPRLSRIQEHMNTRLPNPHQTRQPGVRKPEPLKGDWSYLKGTSFE